MEKETHLSNYPWMGNISFWKGTLPTTNVAPENGWLEY